MIFSIGTISQLVLLWPFLPSLSWAYSFGAGGCDGGIPAVGPPHLPPFITSVTNGTLATGSIDVLLDGVALTHDVPASFLIGKTHTITVKRASQYKGVLIRLAGVGINALSPTDSLHTLAPYCPQFGVSGITHNSNVLKSQSDAALTVSTATGNLPLDITVVVQNSLGRSEFYYTGFVIQAVASLSTPIAKPVAPTVKPVAPTVKPVAPTVKPVAPTVKPVAPTVTLKPGNGTHIKVPPGACFSNANTVQVAGKGTISMQQLEIGDWVQSGDGISVTQVYSFGHYAESFSAEYLQLMVKEMVKPFEISKDHMVFVNNDKQAIPAGSVVIGDRLHIVGHSPEEPLRMAEVIKIKSVSRRGAFAPFTTSGSIMISGVASSSYVTLQEDSPVLVIMGRAFTPFTYQWMAHVLQSPHRLFCRVRMDVCKKETYNDEGLSHWAAVSFKLSKWLLRQHGSIVALLLVPALLLGLAVQAVEVLLVASISKSAVVLAPLFMVIMFLVTAVGYRFSWTRSKAKVL